MDDRIYSEKEVKNIYKMYVKQMADEDVSKVTGQSISALRQFRSIRGWLTKYSKRELETVRKLAKLGYSDTSIGKRVGRKPETIEFWRKRHNIAVTTAIREEPSGYGQSQKPRTSYHDETPCCPLCRKPVGRKENLCWTCNVVQSHHKAIVGGQ